MQSEAKQGILFSCPQPKNAADFSQHSYLLYKKLHFADAWEANGSMAPALEELEQAS